MTKKEVKNERELQKNNKNKQRYGSDIKIRAEIVVSVLVIIKK
jgi:hypothetical protein